MYNSGRRGKRASDGYGIISQADKFYQTEYSIPVVTSFAVTDGSYVPLDDTAVDTAGGQTIVLYGSGFAPGATVTVGGVTIGAVTYLDQGRLTFTAPAKSSGSYTVVVINSNGGAGILVPGLVYSGVPVWSTSAGSVGSVYETTSVSSTFVATGDAPMTYSVLSGSLPPGTTLSTTGVLSGSAPVESGSTTYSFTIRATDGQLQDTDRSFSLTVNTDLVTFSSPTNNQVITSYEYKPISNVTVAATSAAGYGVVYSSNTRPTGITLNATTGVISGTANTVGNTYTRLTATANTTSRTATRDVVFNVNQDVVTWNTPTDNYTISAYEYSAISNVTANATSAAGFGVLYSANTTPTGITLDANTGLISGAPTTVGNTYSLLTATANTTTRSNTRNVIYNVNQDVVTWSSPADGTTYSLQGGSAIANVTLAATSAAGKSITYTANALPSGLGISGNVIYGTPDTAQTVTTLLTATAATTNRTATRTISWSISLGDTYWKYTSLLLNANTPTPTFINDASLNNNQLTIFGDTKPNNFNPYSQGYYSFNGTVPSNNTNGCITTPTSANLRLDQGNWTIEFWIYLTAFNTNHRIFDTGANGSSTAMTIGYNSSGVFNFGRPTSGTGVATAAGAVTLGKWYHVALTTETGNTNGRIWINGVLAAGPTAYTQWTGTSASFAIGRNNVAASDWTGLNGYMSNFRFVSGQQLYTSAFTPDTKPLTTNTYTTDGGTSYSTITGTCQLLTLQDSSYKDKSLNNFLLTPAATYTAISPAHPFTTPTTAAYNTLYSTYFDGTSTTPLTISTGSGQLNLPGDFTVELWFYDAGTSKTLQQFAWSSGGLTCGINAYDGNSTRKLDWRVGGSAPIYGVSAITPYTWHHAAYVKSGSTFRIFLDGKLEYYNASYTSTFTSTTTYIGGANNGDTNYSFLGHISNFRVVKGTAVYTTASTSVGTQVFTPPTSQLTAVENTALLTCQNSTLIDNSTNALTITSSGNQKPVAVSPFTMTTANTTVTNLGSTYAATNSSYLSYAPGGSDAFGTGDFTVECWFYPTVQSVNICMASSGTGSWDLLTYANQLYWHENGGNLGGTGYGDLPLNSWHHLAVSRSGTTIKLFINGVQVYSATNSYNYSGAPATRGIGAVNGGSAPAYVSDFRVIKGTALYTSNFLPPQNPLTAVANTQLLTCQTNGGATNNGFVDQSSFNNIITRNGNTTQGTFSPYSQNGWSNYFDGSPTKYVSTPSTTLLSLGSGDYTIEFWCYSNSLGSGTAGCPFVSWDTTYQQLLRHNGSIWECYYKTGSTIPSVSTSTVGINQWVHQALVRRSGTVTWYLNGVSRGTAADSTNFSTAMYYQIGNYGGYQYDGYVSNVRVVKGTAVYTANFTPPTSPLAAIPGTVFLSCNSNRFIDTSANSSSLTVSGGPAVQAFSPFGGTTSVPTSYSSYFDGTGDYITSSMGTAFGTGDFTIELWTYLPSTGFVNGGGIIYTSSTSALGTMEILLRPENSTYWRVYAGGGQNINYSSAPVTDQWIHHAIVRISGVTTYYFNGVSKGSITDTTNYAATFANIGYYSNYLPVGYISNVRIVRGTGVYTTNFTPPTTSLTAISGTSLLTCQSNTNIDNSNNKFTLTVSGDTIPSSFNPFGLTNTTIVSYTPSVNGGSMYFDGSGDGLTTDYTKFTGSGTSNFTYEAWVYFTSVGTGCVMGSGDSGGNISSCATIYLSASGTLRVYGPSVSGNASTNVTVNQWYHIALTRITNTFTLYLNGIAQGTFSDSGSIAYSSSKPFTVGRMGVYAGQYLTGYISDARVTTGVALYTSNFYPGPAPLTPTTTIGANTYSSSLLLNGTSGGIIDYHGTNNLETVGDVTLAPQDPYSGSYYSNYFDGVGDTLTLSSNAAFGFGTGDFTIELWVNCKFNGAIQELIDARAADDAQPWVFGINGTGLARTYDGATLRTGGQLVENQWNHVAWVRISNVNTIYVNGVSGHTWTASQNFTSARSLVIGNNIGPTSEPYTGYMSNLRIVKGTGVYTGAFTPPTSPLSAISGTSLLTCQSNRLIDNSTNAFTITRNGDVAVKSFNPFRQNTAKSLYFDGTGDYLAWSPLQNTIFGTGDFTVEFWVNFSNSSGTGFYFLENRNSSQTSTWAFFRNTSDYIEWYTGSSSITSSPTKPSSNVWNHIAYSRSGTTGKMFINGSQVNSTTDSTNYNVASTYAIIGSRYSLTEQLNGYIKDLRITKYARYTANFTPPTTTFEVK